MEIVHTVSCILILMQKKKNLFFLHRVFSYRMINRNGWWASAPFSAGLFTVYRQSALTFNSVFPFPSRYFARIQTQPPQITFWLVNGNVSVNMCAIYNRRIMLAFCFVKVLEVKLSVTRGSWPGPWSGSCDHLVWYACCIHVDSHLFVHSYIYLFIRWFIR